MKSVWNSDELDLLGRTLDHESLTDAFLDIKARYEEHDGDPEAAIRLGANLLAWADVALARIRQLEKDEGP